MESVFVTSWFPSRLDPRLGNFVQRHAEALQSVGVRVTVIHIAMRHRILFPKVEKEKLDNLDVVHLFLPKTGAKSPFSLRYWCDVLLKHLRGLHAKPEIVHCHVAYPAGDFALALAEKLRLPLVYTEHWSGFDPGRKQTYTAAVKAQVERVVEKSSAILPVSEYLAEMMRRKGLEGNYKVVPNAVNTKYFFPGKRGKNEHFTFLHISNFEPGIKNTEGILSAFSQINSKNARLIIGGDGDTDRLKAFCKSESIHTENITFRGAIDYEEVAMLNRQSDCFVLFSQFENSPCVIAEALCCGLPVIASNVGGLPEMIQAKNGILVVPSETDGLYRAMLKMIESFGDYDAQSIAEKAKENYAYRAVGHVFLETYRDVMRSLK